MVFRFLILGLISFSFLAPLGAYPIDGYDITGIRRLHYLQLVEKEEIKGRKLIPGATKTLDEITLSLLDKGPMKNIEDYFTIDPEFQEELNALFPRMHESYSWSLLDISPGKPMRYAERKSSHQFQPGSVGKLAVVTGFFAALQKVCPYMIWEKQELLKTKKVRAGYWAIYDEHTIPVFDVEKKKLTRRQARESDVFSLYEWVDHMMSVSNNGAAAVVHREAILMNVFGVYYPYLTEEEANEFFENTPKRELAELGRSTVNDPLRELGIGHEEFRLGGFFTRGAGTFVPRKGGSTGTPIGLMKWMIALESGKIVDIPTSLEIKRLLYMTWRRIRYSAASELRDAAVYFKSGSLYSCNRRTMPGCGKYRGNVKNYMNSIAIIERPDSTTYFVALMSNVLRKNSANDHYALATRIDRIVRKD